MKRVSKTSASSTSRIKSTKSARSNISKQHVSKNAEISQKKAGTKQYKMTGKQTKTWKSLDPDLKDHLHKMIDSCIKMVLSKPVFRTNEEVQQLSSQLKRKLKSSLETIKVPRSRLKNLTKLTITAAELQDEYENITNQQLEIEKEIRQEERLIETLEDGVESESLCLEVPDDTLQLPKMVFSRSLHI